jgi:5-formyltetrahydrofolate cyclo-ligase
MTLRQSHTYICGYTGYPISTNQGARKTLTPVREHGGVTQDSSARKSALRSQLRAARKQRDPGAMAKLDSQISQQISDVLETIEITHGSVIAAYVAMPHEPSMNTLRSQLNDMGCTVLIPIVSGDQLLWALDGNEVSWARNTFGTLEPDPLGARTSSQALPTCTALIVPSQAIDQHGFRLGQGKGFYDRALAEVAGLEHSPMIIGVTFESEFLPEIPTEEHDIPVDVSVTESTVRWFSTPD